MNTKQIQKKAEYALRKWTLVKAIEKLTKNYQRETLMSKGETTLKAILASLKTKK